MAPAIHQTSLFTFDSYEDFVAAFEGKSDHFIYTRGRNPTVDLFERKVAQLEGTEAARAFASGMGAISSTHPGPARGRRPRGLRAQRLPGHLQAPDAVSTPVRRAIRLSSTGPTRRRWCARSTGAKLLYLENPSSLTFDLQDVQALTSAARDRSIVTILDNSWASPLFQQPITLGVDLVVHSASKYISGHSDVVAGMVAGSAARRRRLSGSKYACWARSSRPSMRGC